MTHVTHHLRSFLRFNCRPLHLRLPSWTWLSNFRRNKIEVAADRIMPLFISQELPVGLAGLVVAGIFAAAQSTVSTSMNSGATTIVTDFLRPANFCKSEKGYLWKAAEDLP